MHTTILFSIAGYTASFQMKMPHEKLIVDDVK
jgi:hypothetical protein